MLSPQQRITLQTKLNKTNRLKQKILEEKRAQKEESRRKRKEIRQDWMLSRRQKRELLQSLSRNENAERKQERKESALDRINEKYDKQRQAIEKDWMLSAGQKVELSKKLDRRQREELQSMKDKAARRDPSHDHRRPPRESGHDPGHSR